MHNLLLSPCLSYIKNNNFKVNHKYNLQTYRIRKIMNLINNYKNNNSNKHNNNNNNNKIKVKVKARYNNNNNSNKVKSVKTIIKDQMIIVRINVY
jgi:hypothetical protein